MKKSEVMKKFLKSEIGDFKRVLDVGCGEGSTSIYLASNLNCIVEGIDVEKGKLHRAMKRFDENSAKGLVLCHFCDCRKVDKKFSGESFDFVIIVHALHHLCDLSIVLPKLRGVLKKGGELIIMEYEKSYGEKLDNCPRFSPMKINSMLRTAGFRNLVSRDVISDFVTVIAMK